MSTVLLNSDFKDPASLAKFAKDYWQIREEMAYMYKLKRKTNDDKEQLDLDKTIAVLRKMLAHHYAWGLINTDKIRNAIEVERKHRYEGHIEGIEKREAKKKTLEKELDEYIYIDDDSISKELKK